MRGLGYVPPNVVAPPFDRENHHAAHAVVPGTQIIPANSGEGEGWGLSLAHK